MVPASVMKLNTPYLGPDGAKYVKRFIEGATDKNVEFIHNLGREPLSTTPVWSNKAINFPEVVKQDRERSVLNFRPDWISNYTDRDFTVVMRFY